MRKNGVRVARGRGGFTLVELLVVIGVVALLIAILLPALSRARRHAQAVHCASNMRQIALGWLMYANAHGGVVVPARPPNLAPAANLYSVGNGDCWRPRWYALLGAQTGLHAFDRPDPSRAAENTVRVDNPVFLCPSEPERTSGRHYVYGYNHQFLGNARNKVGTPPGTFRPIHYPVKVSRIAASRTVMFAECMGTAAGKAASQRRGYNNDGAVIDNYALGNHAFALDPPRLTPTSDRCDDNFRSDEHRSAPEPRHLGRANVAFCDGRVEAMTLPEMGYLVRPDGSVAAAGPGTHNCLFSGDGTDRDPPSVR